MSHRAITWTAVFLLAAAAACAPSGTGAPNGNDSATPNDNALANDNAASSNNDNVAAVPGDEEQLVANLDADQQTAAVDSPATGAGTFVLDGARTQLSFQINAAGVTSAVVAAHFYRGQPGTDGDLLFDLTDLIQQDAGSVSISGVWAFETTPFVSVAELVDALLEGGIYVNLLTSNYPLGEVRGQLTLPGSDE